MSNTFGIRLRTIWFPIIIFNIPLSWHICIVNIIASLPCVRRIIVSFYFSSQLNLIDLNVFVFLITVQVLNWLNSTSINPKWAFTSCPPEDECNNGHTKCDPGKEICTDQANGYSCECRNGYVMNERYLICSIQRVSYFQPFLITGWIRICIARNVNIANKIFAFYILSNTTIKVGKNKIMFCKLYVSLCRKALFTMKCSWQIIHTSAKISACCGTTEQMIIGRH